MAVESRLPQTGPMPETGTDSGPLNVLLVEDSAGYAELVARYLDLAGGFGLQRVETLEEANAALQGAHFDCILLDLSLSDAHSLQGVESLRATHPEVPLVVLTGRDDDLLAVAAVAEGAQ